MNAPHNYYVAPAYDATKAWLQHVNNIVTFGYDVSPRGKLTKELPQLTMIVDMREPVLQVPGRALSFQFMAAEAYWILTGDDRVETIAPYNKNIAQFSDDGIRYFGAYGPKIMDQVDFVVEKLRDDPSSRQAIITIWREKPPVTKDVPCTIAMAFSIRDGKVNCHVFMRSSDGWLGVPYDVFNFSMVAHYVTARLNECVGLEPHLEPGNLFLTAASAHVYEPHIGPINEILKDYELKINHAKTPTVLFNDPECLISYLGELRDSKPGSDLRWWE